MENQNIKNLEDMEMTDRGVILAIWQDKTGDKQLTTSVVIKGVGKNITMALAMAMQNERQLREICIHALALAEIKDLEDRL